MAVVVAAARPVAREQPGHIPIGVVLRPMADEERALVASTWVRAMRRPATRSVAGHSFVQFGRGRGMAPLALGAAHEGYVDRLIQHSTVEVAKADGHESAALAWTCYGNGTLHFIWVAKEARGNGLGRALYAHAAEQLGHEFSVTHTTPAGTRLLRHVCT